MIVIMLFDFNPIIVLFLTLDDVNTNAGLTFQSYYSLISNISVAISIFKSLLISILL